MTANLTLPQQLESNWNLIQSLSDFPLKTSWIFPLNTWKLSCTSVIETFMKKTTFFFELSHSIHVYNETK